MTDRTETGNPIEIISDDLRASLSKALDRLDARVAVLLTKAAAVHKRLDAIDAAREALLDPHGLAEAGICEFCSKRLFAGERGMVDAEGVTLCENCAPTYGDIAALVKSGAYDEDDEKEEIAAMIAAHLAAGGRPTDKPVRELDAA